MELKSSGFTEELFAFMKLLNMFYGNIGMVKFKHDMCQKLRLTWSCYGDCCKPLPLAPQSLVERPFLSHQSNNHTFP